MDELHTGPAVVVRPRVGATLDQRRAGHRRDNLP